jgi:hypothetical protein
VVNQSFLCGLCGEISCGGSPLLLGKNIAPPAFGLYPEKVKRFDYFEEKGDSWTASKA